MEKKEFSVLMSIYSKENPDYLELALNSIFNQTLRATEVILVEDGTLPEELETMIVKYEKKYNEFKVIRFKENRGLGNALNDGLKECKYNYIFRMDTDDICDKKRFEKQISYMNKHPEIDVLGSNIIEFKNSLEEETRIKKMPTGNEIKEYIKKRNPLNHMTVCFKKNSVLDCGGYMPMLYLEDYYLWIRMYINGKKIENLDEPLVYARIGNGFEKRRGNKKQIIGWRNLQDYMLKNNLINKSRYYKNIFNMYLMIYCPNFIRKITYKLFLR